MTPRPTILLVSILVLAGCAAGPAPGSASPGAGSTPGTTASPTQALASSAASGPSIGRWTAVTGLATPRDVHTATLLRDGRVLVAGGETYHVETDASVSYEPLASAEVYDPATRTWTTVAPMLEPRVDHTATLLADGRVLIAGGASREFPPGCDGGCDFSLATAELFDPATNTWSATGSLHVARNYAASTLLNDGRVLVAGGYNQGGHALPVAELYDPATGTWARTGDLLDADAANHWSSTVLLFDGTVLAVGGSVLDGSGGRVVVPAEIYHPATGTWTLTGAMPAGLAGTATRLLDGRVLVVGTPGDPPAASGAAIYDPATGTWTATGGLSTGRTQQATTILPDGRVMTMGGGDPNPTGGLTSTEFYDPASGTWSAGPTLPTGRSGATATLLADGSVLLVGGVADALRLSAAVDLWTP